MGTWQKNKNAMNKALKVGGRTLAAGTTKLESCLHQHLIYLISFFSQFDSITAEQILFTFYGNSSPYAHTAMSSGSKQWANQRKHSSLFGVWFDGHAMGLEWAKLLMGFYIREIVLFCFPTSTWPSLILYARSFHAAFLCHPVIMFSQEVFLVAFHLWSCISVII